MKKIVINIGFWLLIAVLTIGGLAAFYLCIYAPGLEAVEFTNVSVVVWLETYLGLSPGTPDTLVKYCAFYPRWLGLLAFWPLLLIPARYSLCDFPLWQRIVSGVLRVVLLGSIVLALVDLEKISETSRVSVIVVADESASVPEEMLRAEESEIRAALAARSAGVDVQVVAFSDVPRIVDAKTASGGERFLRRAGAADGGTSTDIESALRFAYALFPENHVRRIILLSDGNQTRGDALSEAARARAQDIRIDVRHLASAPVREVMIVRDEVPSRDNLRVGQPFEVTVEIESTHAVTAHLAVTVDDAPDAASSRDVSLEPGTSFVALKLQAPAPGEMRVQFALEGIDPSEDRFLENNALADRFGIQGRPKILYIEQDAAAASYLQRALAGYGASSGQDFEVEVRGATGLPTTMKELRRYAAVILGDVPRTTSSGRVNVTSGNMALIRDYVRRGGGFIALGGEHAFGPGGYENTTIEKILPVEFKNEQPRKKQTSAIALLIDKSGSMELNRNLDIAKEAAKASVSALKAQDRVLVIGFDDTPYIVVPSTRAVNRYRINDRISRMRPAGGTNIRSALESAYLELSMVSAKTKHVILLTDGRSPYTGIDSLVREMVRARITVSTVAMADADTTLLGRIASLGRGRAYIARDPSSVPRIFIEETNRVANRAIVEEPFVPHVARAHEMIRGVKLQTLLGYVGTKAKSGSRPILTAPGGAPILSHWQLGAGRTTVFTSDAKNRWASQWIRESGSFAQFWAQVVRSTMKQEDETRFEMRVVRENERARVIVDAVSDDDRFLNGLSIGADIIRPDGRNIKLDLPQTAPGFYENTFVLPVYGTYEARAELFDGKESIGFARKTFSFPYAREYASIESDGRLLDAVARTSGGFVDKDLNSTFDTEGAKLRTYSPMWSNFLWIALLALLFDVFFRRVRLARR